MKFSKRDFHICEPRLSHSNGGSLQYSQAKVLIGLLLTFSSLSLQVKSKFDLTPKYVQPVKLPDHQITLTEHSEL